MMTIDVSPEEFVFADKEKRLQLRTLVHVRASGKAKGSFVIAAIGDAPRDIVDFVTIKLFERDTEHDSRFSKFECLQSFLKYGISQMQQKWAFLRPVVMIRGIDSLHPFLSGYQVPIVGRSIEAAGAREVRFERPSGMQAET